MIYQHFKCKLGMIIEVKIIIKKLHKELNTKHLSFAINNVWKEQNIAK